MPRPLQFKSGSLIYARREDSKSIYFLHKGIVSLVFEDIETKADIRSQVQQGEFFGAQSALGGYPREDSAVAIADSIILVYTVSEFEVLALSNTSIILPVLKTFSGSMRRIHNDISKLTNTADIPPDEGLFSVGEKYLKLRRYPHARYVFNRYLAHFPEGRRAPRVTRNLQIIDIALAIADDNNDQRKIVTDKNFAMGIDTSKNKAADMELAPFARFARVFQPDEIIFAEYEQGNTVYLIQSGRVKLLKNAGEHERLLDVLSPLEIFGEMAILDGMPRSASAIALDEVKAIELTLQNFEILLLGNPYIAFRILEVYSKKIYMSKRRFMIFALPDPQAKFADVFLMLDEIQASIDKEGISREFRLTVEDIALWAGMSVDDANEVMNYFIARRSMEKQSDRIIIRNINDLNRFVTLRRSFKAF